MPLEESDDSPYNATAQNTAVVHATHNPSFVNAGVLLPPVGGTITVGCTVLRKDILYRKRVISCSYNNKLLKRKTIKTAKIVFQYPFFTNLTRSCISLLL